MTWWAWLLASILTAAAYVLRHVAEQFEAEAAAEQQPA